MVKALNEQAQKLWHLSNVVTNEPALKLAQRLTELTFAERVFFCNSGGAANEAAFKLARRWDSTNFGSEKNMVLASDKAFHGRNLFTVRFGATSTYSHS